MHQTKSTLKLIIQKCLSSQMPLFFSFVDYEHTIDSADRRVLAEVLSLYVLPDKYIKIISAMYKNNTAAVKVRGEVSNWFDIEWGARQDYALYSFVLIILTKFVLKSTSKIMGEHRIQ